MPIGRPLPGAVERGRAGETVAALFLRLNGIEVLDANRRRGTGEIDLIARDGSCLVFVEVRLRRRDAWSPAAATVNVTKRRRLRDAASRLLRERDDLCWPGRRVRFDVVTLALDAAGLDVRHLRNVRI